VLAGLWFASVPRSSAEQAGQPPPGSVTMRVLPLKHAPAVDVARILQEVYAGKEVRVAVDERANTVIVGAKEDLLADAQRLIVILDTEQAQREPARTGTRIFRLANMAADQGLGEILKKVWTPPSGSRFALDPARNCVIASGSPAALQELESVLRELDVAPARGPGAEELQLRIVWLASDPGRKDADLGPPPPDDLKEVVAELARVGVRDPHLVCQMIVNTSPDGVFDMQGSARLETIPCVVNVSGEVAERAGGAPGVQIQFEAFRSDEPGGKPDRRANAPAICRLHTGISAPPGHAVVLGVTPTDGKTSAFVVQLLPRKAAAKRP
jgi:hypothetical protein